jgi:hypothetical protein
MSNKVKFMVKANDGRDNEAPSVPRKKKPYKMPEVTCYGNVAQLTAGVNGTDFDTGHSMRNRK